MDGFNVRANFTVPRILLASKDTEILRWRKIKKQFSDYDKHWNSLSKPRIELLIY